MPTRSLPPEIISAIFNQVRDPSGRQGTDHIWAKCALVSKPFLHIAREALYRNLSFELKQTEEEDHRVRTVSLDTRSQLLFDTLVAAPTVGAHVRQLFFTGFDLVNLATFEKVLEAELGVVGALTDMNFLKFSIDGEVDSNVLERLLRTSQDSLAELTFEWVLHEQTFDFGPFVALRTLYVNIPWDNQQQAAKLLDAVGGCPNLHEFHTDHQDAHDERFQFRDSVIAIEDLRPFHRLPSSLLTITFFGLLSISTPYLVKFLNDSQCLPNLENLQLETQVQGNRMRRTRRSEEDMAAIKVAVRTSGIRLVNYTEEEWFEEWSDSDMSAGEWASLQEDEMVIDGEEELFVAYERKVVM